MSRVRDTPKVDKGVKQGPRPGSEASFLRKRRCGGASAADAFQKPIMSMIDNVTTTHWTAAHNREAEFAQAKRQKMFVNAAADGLLRDSEITAGVMMRVDAARPLHML